MATHKSEALNVVDAFSPSFCMAARVLLTNAAVICSRLLPAQERAWCKHTESTMIEFPCKLLLTDECERWSCYSADVVVLLHQLLDAGGRELRLRH